MSQNAMFTSPMTSLKSKQEAAIYETFLKQSIIGKHIMQPHLFKPSNNSLEQAMASHGQIHSDAVDWSVVLIATKIPHYDTDDSSVTDNSSNTCYTAITTEIPRYDIDKFPVTDNSTTTCYTAAVIVYTNEDEPYQWQVVRKSHLQKDRVEALEDLLEKMMRYYGLVSRITRDEVTVGTEVDGEWCAQLSAEEARMLP